MLRQLLFAMSTRLLLSPQSSLFVLWQLLSMLFCCCFVVGRFGSYMLRWRLPPCVATLITVVHATLPQAVPLTANGRGAVGAWPAPFAAPGHAILVPAAAAWWVRVGPGCAPQTLAVRAVIGLPPAVQAATLTAPVISRGLCH